MSSVIWLVGWVGFGQQLLLYYLNEVKCLYSLQHTWHCHAGPEVALSLRIQWVEMSSMPLPCLSEKPISSGRQWGSFALLWPHAISSFSCIFLFHVPSKSLHHPPSLKWHEPLISGGVTPATFMHMCLSICFIYLISWSELNFNKLPNKVFAKLSLSLHTFCTFCTARPLFPL